MREAHRNNIYITLWNMTLTTTPAFMRAYLSQDTMALLFKLKKYNGLENDLKINTTICRLILALTDYQTFGDIREDAAGYVDPILG